MSIRILRVSHQLSEVGRRKALGGAVGRGSALPHPCIVEAVSRRQSERTSRFKVEIEDGVRSVAVALRDDDVGASIRTVVRLWWTSHLRGRHFAELVHQAYAVTQRRISIGAVERGDAGRREAMPYFLAVLRDLVMQDGLSRRL